MVVDWHNGYTHTLDNGSEIHIQSTEPGRITVTFRAPGGFVGNVTMNPDEALQVASSLLREQNLERFGNG